MKFEIGEVVATPGALKALETAKTNPLALLGRHLRGDWGDVCAADKKANDDAVKHGERLLSSYTLCSGKKVWLLTEWDRSYTTFLLPDEY